MSYAVEQSDQIPRPKFGCFDGWRYACTESGMHNCCCYSCEYWVCSEIIVFVEVVVAGTRFSFTLLVGLLGLLGFWVWDSRFCRESSKSESTTGLVSFIFCKLRAFDEFCFSGPPFLYTKTMYIQYMLLIEKEPAFPLQACNDLGIFNGKQHCLDKSNQTYLQAINSSKNKSGCTTSSSSYS